MKTVKFFSYLAFIIYIYIISPTLVLYRQEVSHFLFSKEQDTNSTYLGNVGIKCVLK